MDIQFISPHSHVEICSIRNTKPLIQENTLKVLIFYLKKCYYAIALQINLTVSLSPLLPFFLQLFHIF